MLAPMLVLLLASGGPDRPAFNTRCPVRGNMKVDKSSPAATVRGRIYRVCCEACGKKLQADSDAYLDRSGRPLNLTGAPRDTPSEPERHKH